MLGPTKILARSGQPFSRLLDTSKQTSMNKDVFTYLRLGNPVLLERNITSLKGNFKVFGLIPGSSYQARY